jgi:hypothetical protein
MISYLVADCKTFVEGTREEVALLHSHILAGYVVHTHSAEVVPLIVRGVPHSPFGL